MPSHSSRCWIALNMYEEDLLWVWSGWGTLIKRTNRDPPPIPTTSTLSRSQRAESKYQGVTAYLWPVATVTGAEFHYIMNSYVTFASKWNSSVKTSHPRWLRTCSMFHRYIPALSMTTNRDPRQNNAETQRNVGSSSWASFCLLFGSRRWTVPTLPVASSIRRS